MKLTPDDTQIIHRWEYIKSEHNKYAMSYEMLVKKTLKLVFRALMFWEILLPALISNFLQRFSVGIKPGDFLGHYTSISLFTSVTITAVSLVELSWCLYRLQ